MELKDVILSTLAELDEKPSTPPVSSQYEVKETLNIETKEFVKQENTEDKKSSISDEKPKFLQESELIYLNSIKERLLVLFEGFQSPNNTNIEAKIDMTLNFLEYTLATIDTRIEILEKGKK